MQMRYVRQTTRERYEQVLVEALNALGFEATLSPDAEDELIGIDAWVNYQGRAYPIDFASGCERGQFYATKLAKAECRGILVLHIPDDLINNLHNPDKARVRQALIQIKEKTHRTLRNARFLDKVLTQEDTQAQLQERYRELHRTRSRRLVAA
jgi:hypothetical protein